MKAPLKQAGAIRRPAGGGYPTGDVTRSRIIAAATEVFGQFGYASASTREIAARAGVKTPALQYYFGNKLGLFEACIDVITRQIWSALAPAVSEAEKAALEGAPTAGLIACFCRIQDGLLDCFFSSGEGQLVQLLILRNTTAETADARMLLHSRVSEPLFKVKCGLVGRIIGKPAEDPETHINTFAVSGVFMNFYLSHDRIMRTLGWKHDNEANAAKLKPILREKTMLLLDGMARAHGTWRAGSPPRIGESTVPKATAGKRAKVRIGPPKARRT